MTEQMSPAVAMPRLDAHAHLAPDVTPAQVRSLGDCHIFAVTRTLEEAAHVRAHPARNLLWGLGTHPGVTEARDGFDVQTFARLLPAFALIGEIGLDRRAGHLAQQVAILRQILRLCADQPVLLSVHSSGHTTALLDAITDYHLPGLVLHWWNSEVDLPAAIDLDAYFSVNAAMSPSVLRGIPVDRILTETDFPARSARAKRPGDTDSIEHRLAQIHGLSMLQVRHQVWVNLRRVTTRAQALDRLPEPLAERLLSL